MMTDRETFERVRTHMLTQGRQSKAVGNACRYRLSLDDGDVPEPVVLRCAVGCLLPDDPRRIALCEGRGVHNLIPGPERWEGGTWEADEVLSDLLNEAGVPASKQMLDMLHDLQKVHDRSAPRDWPEMLEEVRLRYLGPDRGDRLDHDCLADHSHKETTP